ncbi:chaplin [Streptomyces sp. NPDC018584]|uniref:chaplin n=1 Tax=unclassified Streptomyces TaxID=2593676 RepID=UPI003796E99C
MHSYMHGYMHSHMHGWRRPKGGRRTLATAALTTLALVCGAPPAAADPRPDDTMQGSVGNSPGYGSGNLVQNPVKMSYNFCGNTINVAGVPSPAVGNVCEPA